MDRSVRAGYRSVWSRAPVTFRKRRLVGRSHRSHVGVQRWESAWRSTGAHHHRYRGGRGAMVFLRGISSLGSASHSPGRYRDWKFCRIGLKSRIGLIFRARHEVFVLLVNERFEDLSDHAEMVALSLELPLEID